MNWGRNFREEHEPAWWLREDRVTELSELISTWIFKIIITNPKDIEFRQRPGYEYVSVFDKWEFICYITKEQYHQFVDEDSIINTHFDTIKKVVE
jgi:hypothetical protein